MRFSRFCTPGVATNCRGANFTSVLNQIRQKLGKNAVPLQLPIGAEDQFKGVIDLVQMKALIWSAEAAKGEMYDTLDIPDTHVEAARTWHDRLIGSLGLVVAVTVAAAALAFAVYLAGSTVIGLLEKAAT